MKTNKDMEKKTSKYIYGNFPDSSNGNFSFTAAESSAHI